jgi:hypothetical protein
LLTAALFTRQIELPPKKRGQQRIKVKEPEMNLDSSQNAYSSTLASADHLVFVCYDGAALGLTMI